MVYGYIYKILFPNEKHYIGLTSRSLEDRQKEHKLAVKSGNYNNLVYRALTKYEMVDNFELVEIDTADTLEELREKEIRYIQEYDSYYMGGNGYNMTLGGEGTNGYIHTEEAKEKMSKIQKERLKNPEERERLSKSQTERLKDPELRQRLSDKTREHFKNNPAARQSHREKALARFQNPEELQKHSEMQKKIQNRVDVKQKKGKYKPFDVFKKDGTFIKSFNFQFEAAEYLQNDYQIKSTLSNINSRICKVLNNHTKSAYGFVFKYKE